MFFITPRYASFILFIFILIFLILIFFRVLKRIFPDHYLFYTFLIFIYLSLVSLIGFFGLLKIYPMMIPVFMLTMVLIIFLIAFSNIGKKIAETYSFQSLILFQLFRGPLEIVLHDWYLSKSIPETMTWTGSNFDIITPICALIFSLKYFQFKKAILLFNLVGLTLLINVMRVALLSTILPFAWKPDPPLQLIEHFPTILIAPVCVGGALLVHLISLRKLRAP